MAAESILTYKRPGFPVVTDSEKSIQTDIEYVGPTATLESAKPAVGAAWGDYLGTVSASSILPTENTAYSVLSVTVRKDFEASGGGVAREVNYEIEWVMFQRSLFEHPVFRTGGAHALDATDVADIEAWRNETNPTLKAAFKYNELAVTGSGSEASLSAAAQKFCEALNLGIETYEDFAPVARKVTLFAGGPPGTSVAGAKDAPPSLPGLPTGYEWRKSADRSVRAGGQRKWERVEEWTGAIKVLVDKNTIYF